MKRRYIVKSIKNRTYTKQDLIMSAYDPFTTYSHVDYIIVSAFLDIICEKASRWNAGVRLIKMHDKCKMKIEVSGDKKDIDAFYTAFSRSELMKHFTVKKVLF